MSDIKRTQRGDNLSWADVGLWIGIVEGGNVAEVEIDYGYHSAEALREMANALNEAAEKLAHSPSIDRELVESIHYLETHQQHIGILLNGFTVNVPASRISESIIALAKALRAKDGQS